MATDQKHEDKVTLRLPVGTIDRLRTQAKRHSRSINGEATWALLQYLEQQEKEDRSHAQDV
jgi:plasmid stability protein